MIKIEKVLYMGRTHTTGGCNLPQEVPQAFAQAIVDVDGL